MGEKHPPGELAKQVGSKQLLSLSPWENLLGGCAGFSWDSLGAQKDCFGLSPVSLTEPLAHCSLLTRVREPDR